MLFLAREEARSEDAPERRSCGSKRGPCEKVDVHRWPRRMASLRGGAGDPAGGRTSSYPRADPAIRRRSRISPPRGGRELRDARRPVRPHRVGKRGAPSEDGRDTNGRLRVAREQASAADRGVLADKVHRAVRTLLLHGKASGADISQALAMHRRTLNRRLTAEGTTFQQVLDRVRFAVAKELLENSELALPEIASALGYANSVAFIPAFRRWTGTTPGAWRQSPHR